MREGQLSVRRVKIHEAGHAVVAALAGQIPVSIVIYDNYNGVTNAVRRSRIPNGVYEGMIAMAGDVATRYLGMGPDRTKMSHEDKVAIERLRLSNEEMKRAVVGARLSVLAHLREIEAIADSLVSGRNVIGQYWRHLPCSQVRT